MKLLISGNMQWVICANCDSDVLVLKYMYGKLFGRCAGCKLEQKIPEYKK